MAQCSGRVYFDKASARRQQHTSPADAPMCSSASSSSSALAAFPAFASFDSLFRLTAAFFFAFCRQKGKCQSTAKAYIGKSFQERQHLQHPEGAARAHLSCQVLLRHHRWRLQELEYSLDFTFLQSTQQH